MHFHSFHQTIFYESNTRLFSAKLRIKIGKELAKEYLNLKEVRASHYLWAMGIWKKSPESIRIAKTHLGLKKEFKKALPNYKDSDIIGSPYSVYDYSPDSDLCESWEDLASFRDELNRNGVKLLLDFVPNHMSVDSEWIGKCPNAFLEVNPQLKKEINYFQHTSGRFLAHGRDPYFDGWTDTVQFDFSSEDTLDLHLLFLNRISNYCDGLRCDMAMLPLSKIFEITHGKKGFEFYWEEMIRKTKLHKQNFLFLAEVYWNLESLLQKKGFDFTYDKDLYDHLVSKNSEAIIFHLQSDKCYMESSMKFLENHDENRMNSTFFRDSISFFALISNTPGGLLIHEGQSSGLKKKIPVQLGVYPLDEMDEYIFIYFSRILPRLTKRKKKPIQMILKSPIYYESGDQFALVRILLYDDGDREIFIFNPNNYSLSGRIRFEEDELINIFLEGSASFLDLIDGISYVQNLDEIKEMGMYFRLDGWSCHWFLLI